MNLSFERDFPDKEWDSAFKLTLPHEDSEGFISHGIGTGSPANLTQSCSVKKRSIHIGSSPNRPRILKCQKRRRLPGPAGMLPQTDGYMLPTKSRSTSTQRKRSSSTSALHSVGFSSPQSPGSQTEESELLSRLRTDCGSSIWPLVEKYSITNVLQMITKGQLPRGKVPVMCGFLDDVELLPTDAKAVLKDSTGFVGCTVHRSVVKAYKGQLTTCALLLLKQVSLFSPTGKNFYVNLTLSNIVRVYTAEQTFPVLASSRSVSQHRTSRTPPFTRSELHELECECLRTISPPAPVLSLSTTPMSSRSKSSRMLNSQKRPNHVSEHPRTLPSKHLSNTSTPKPPFTRLDTSLSNSLDYRLHPQSTITGSAASTAGLMSFTPMRPGLGSLVRSATLCSGLPSTRVTKSIGAPADRKTADTPSDTAGLDVTANLLDDDMDELLSSLAEKSVNDLASV
ncbi:hypothetical protein PHET_03944 [Paragonimus heterotremus]|uniref:Homologous recombination OB-fold protein OB-fold domain-containing protein n=1 Tax=Paragonimus heterotremus TaxID=100268 RepID=A0A8J4WSJ3_9TREM|nr:hypothetical protein PHET_03944 [Paragonimus heterotremus]